MWENFHLGSAGSPITRPSSLFLILACAAAFAPACIHGKETLTTTGVVREFNAPAEEVRQAVIAVAHDQIVHGTMIFDKEPLLNGAEAVDSTPLFDPWTGPGEVYYKIRKNAIAPRHFKDSADQGTIAVRYILVPIDAERTRVKVDAIYVEASHRLAHDSDGNVEKTELKEIKDHLEALEEEAAAAADARRRQ